MNIPDEAWDAFQKAYHTYRHTRSPDPGDEGCFDSNARKHALNAALPYIMEGVAREYDRKAEAHAVECHRREAAGERVRMGEFAKAGKIRGIADDLRSLAPMEKGADAT